MSRTAVPAGENQPNSALKNAGTEHTHTETSEDALRRIQTAGSITISPEIFEKIYLTPANKVKGDLRSKFANPTPL
jgi:uncharacterized protein